VESYFSFSTEPVWPVTNTNAFNALTWGPPHPLLPLGERERVRGDGF